MARLLPYRLSKQLSRFWGAIRKWVGIDQLFPITVNVYRGFGTSDHLFLRGRVLRDKTIIRGENDTRWNNFINTIKRFNSWEIEGAKLTVAFQGHSFLLETDTEGYFTLDQKLSPPISCPPSHEPFWQSATIQVQSIPGQKVSFDCTADFILPDKNSDYGIISDIDDTILKTYVTSWLKWRPIYLTLIHNAISRQIFSGTVNFFHSLRLGHKGESYNPFFYISNSPWNLYDLLEEFITYNKLPRGPILLRDFGLPYEEVPATYQNHKHHHITKVLQLYPHLSFILIGDSGEKDVDIYCSICKAFPDRIKAVYIRDVRSKKRAERVQKVLDTIPNIPCLLVKDYEDAILHARNITLIGKGIEEGE